jgi:hypothetical protein
MLRAHGIWRHADLVQEGTREGRVVGGQQARAAAEMR